MYLEDNKHLCFSYAQLSPYFQSEGEYGISKDVDIALWLDSRAFDMKPQLREVCDFIIINGILHDEFDEFKAKETHPGFSLLPAIELLQYWNVNVRATPIPVISRYGKQYLHLDDAEVDKLCEWVQLARQSESLPKFLHQQQHVCEEDSDDLHVDLTGIVSVQYCCNKCIQAPCM